MPRILLTAFEPYDDWTENSSWLTLMELTRWFDSGGKVVTRRYPVDFSEMMHRMSEDLLLGFDYAVHLGQSPGSPGLKLETTGLNLLESGEQLMPNAPTALKTSLPLDTIAGKLLKEGIPAFVSDDAGTYVCNAAMFFSQYFSAKHGLPTKSCFVHLPIAPHQAASRIPRHNPLPSMSLPMMATGLAIMLGDLLLMDRDIRV
jgi:pyroglutamyl-peptidase